MHDQTIWHLSRLVAVSGLRKQSFTVRMLKPITVLQFVKRRELTCWSKTTGSTGHAKHWDPIQMPESVNNLWIISTKITYLVLTSKLFSTACNNSSLDYFSWVVPSNVIHHRLQELFMTEWSPFDRCTSDHTFSDQKFNSRGSQWQPYATTKVC